MAESHVAAVAIVVLLYWSLYWGFIALWSPLVRAANFLFTAVAIRDIPYFSSTFTIADRFELSIAFAFLFNSFVCLAAAWLLSRWAYGTGPLRSLSRSGKRLARRNHV